MNTIKTQDIIEHLYNDDTGDAKATIYRLFPGVEVAYISAHTSFFDFTEIEQRVLNNYIGFHYCIRRFIGFTSKIVLFGSNVSVGFVVVSLSLGNS